jgi:hypothetical protein
MKNIRVARGALNAVGKQGLPYSALRGGSRNA